MVVSDGQIENLLDRLVGCELYSVQFVRDHVQLHFEDSVDSPVLTCYVMPKVTKFAPDAAELVDDSPGFADALRAFIDEGVRTATAAVGTGLVIELRTGAIALNPTIDQLEGPEIAMLSGFKDRSWTVWRPGEDEFAELT